MKPSKVPKAIYLAKERFPSGVNEPERRGALDALAHRPRRGRARRQLFAAKLPTPSGPLFVLLTNHVTDLAVLREEDGRLVPRAGLLSPPEKGYNRTSRVRLAGPRELDPRGEFPAGTAVVPPRPLSDDDWNRLASQTYLRDTLSDAPEEHADEEHMSQFAISPGGAELADRLLGAKFRGTFPWRALYVLADEDHCGVDVFAVPRGGHLLRHLVTLDLEL